MTDPRDRRPSTFRVRWIVFALVAALGVIAVIPIFQRPPEPVHQGRTLTSWLESHLPTSSANPPYGSPGWHEADKALRAIGTNAIPTLQTMLRRKDPPSIVGKLLKWAEQKRWIDRAPRYAYQLHEEACYAFEILGTNAASAAPGLLDIYRQNVSLSSQNNAARSLGHLGRTAIAAMPWLIANFHHTNSEVRFNAVTAVYHIGGDPSVVVPAFVDALHDAQVGVRWNALSGLQSLGAKARPAIPEILKMFNDPGMTGSSRLTNQVEMTVWRIAPEKLASNLVIGDATSLISNNVTTEAIKFDLHGRRQVLVPSGTGVPAVRQYWNSDPRPFLTVHVGPDKSNAQDRLLGRFEVLGVPATDSVNISTLCIIADGKIHLGARLNSGDWGQMLGIRRLTDESGK